MKYNYYLHKKRRAREERTSTHLRVHEDPTGNVMDDLSKKQAHKKFVSRDEDCSN